MRGQKLFVRPIEATDRDVLAAFLKSHEETADVPACGLLGRLVGDVVAVLSMELTPDAILLGGIVVKGELRRKRIGRAMLRELEQLAVKMDRKRIVVEDARGAEEFFRRVGFSAEGARWVRLVG